MPSRYRIGFDIGGTFTDFILLDPATESVRLHKTLTTPDDPSRGALAGLDELVSSAGIALAEVTDIVHGTTLVTNALIERKGAKLGLLTTQGFRDILEMGTEQRYDIYDLFLQFPTPLVPRRHRLEIPERMDRDGKIVTPLDEAAVEAAARRLAAQGIEAIAIGFLHSYRNPDHERRAAAIVRAACPDMSVSISSDVVSEMWEYQRFCTTCANAFVQPLMDRYLRRLERELRLRGFAGALRLMHSAGGLLSPETARLLPIRLLESGPAGGGLATAFFGALAGHRDIISFDMGGTTAKACLIEDGAADVAPMMEAARVHRFKKGSGLPIKAPVIDMIEIGAGGGSIAAIDGVGLLRVGPHSAGAAPGPACYGQGGTDPTVTDANLLLGYYDPGFFLGGRMALDVAAAEAALARVGEGLNLSALETAAGIYRLVSENMAAAARIHIVEKGRDPRGYAMVGFGGAGPAHAASVARILGVREVLIPPASGAASALGFLAAPLSFEQVRSFSARLDDAAGLAGAETLLAELTGDVSARLTGAGTNPADIVVERSADMRLAGQLHEINVTLPPGTLDQAAVPALRAAFATAYAARYTQVYDGVPVEIVGLRIRARGPIPALSAREEQAATTGAARKGSRRAWFEGGFAETAVYDRYALAEGTTIAGPAIVEEREFDHGNSARGHAHRGGRRHAAHRDRRRGPGGPEDHGDDPDRRGRRDPGIGPRLARDHVGASRNRGGGDVADHLPHGILADHFGSAGFRLRPARRRRREPGALATRHAGVQPHAATRGQGAAREIPGPYAGPRRYPCHQRSLALRRPPVRHRRGDAHLPWRAPRRLRRHGRPCRRYRRHQGLTARAGDLR